MSTQLYSNPRSSAFICGFLLLLLTGGAARAHVKGGRQALLKGGWKEAEAAFKSAPAAEKGPALLGLGELYLTTGRYPEALQQAAQAAAIPAVKSQALCLAGEVQRETGKTAEAVRSFQSALA